VLASGGSLLGALPVDTLSSSTFVREWLARRAWSGDRTEIAQLSHLYSKSPGGLRLLAEAELPSFKATWPVLAMEIRQTFGKLRGM
jgi:hypothetical protein